MVNHHHLQKSMSLNLKGTLMEIKKATISIDNKLQWQLNVEPYQTYLELTEIVVASGL